MNFLACRKKMSLQASKILKEIGMTINIGIRIERKRKRNLQDPGLDQVVMEEGERDPILTIEKRRNIVEAEVEVEVEVEIRKRIRILFKFTRQIEKGRKSKIIFNLIKYI